MLIIIAFWGYLKHFDVRTILWCGCGNDIPCTIFSKKHAKLQDWPNGTQNHQFYKNTLKLWKEETTRFFFYVKLSLLNITHQPSDIKVENSCIEVPIPNSWVFKNNEHVCKNLRRTYLFSWRKDVQVSCKMLFFFFFLKNPHVTKWTRSIITCQKPTQILKLGLVCCHLDKWRMICLPFFQRLFHAFHQILFTIFFFFFRIVSLIFVWLEQCLTCGFWHEWSKDF